MARISTYIIDQPVDADDKWIGTAFGLGTTKNFTARGVASFLNTSSSIAGQTNFFFQTNLNPIRLKGSISFLNGGGVNTPFSTLTSIKVSKYSYSDKLIIEYLQTMVGLNILISQTDDINSFGVYKLNSLTQDPVELDFLDASLELVISNGALLFDKFYTFMPYASGVTDLSYTPGILDGIVNSSSGTDAVIPLAGLINAGLFSAAEKSKLGGIQTGAQVNVNADWDATSGDAQILNKPTIPSITNLVPYTGATTNVDLGLNDITANSFVKANGTGENVLLDDGNTIALTSIESITTTPITADLEVGGIADQQVIPIGTDLQEFATLLLKKTYYPTFTLPSFSLTYPTSTREVGSASPITLTFNYNDGNIVGATSGGIWVPTASQGGRSGPAISYTINGITQAGNTLSVSPILTAGATQFSGTVTYGIGIQPLDSKGVNYDDPYPAGTSPPQQTTITGIYPYFWHKSTSPITSAGMQTAIANGTATKVLASSTGTITIDFDAVGEYLAFAYPSASTTKTVWYVTGLDNGFIPGGVFGGVVTLPCTSPASPTILWSNVSYKIHVTAGPISRLDPMQLRNS